MAVSEGRLLFFRRFLPLGIAVVMASVATILVHRYLDEQRRALEAGRRQLDAERRQLMEQYAQKPVEIVVATKDLAAGEPIRSSDVKVVVVPEKFIQPYAVHNPNKLLAMIPLAPIAEGEQVLANKIRSPEAVPLYDTLSNKTPKGKRAITIAVDTLSGVGGFIRPGDAVDVLWTLPVSQPGEKQGQLVTVTMFQDVPVLAVGTETVGGSAPSRAKGTKGKTEAPPAEGGDSARGGSSGGYLATLALTPQETSLLLFAREQGRIQLSLRSRVEGGERVTIPPANLNTVMEAVLGAPPAPPPAAAPPAEETKAAPAAGPHHVEVYKGLTKEVVVLNAND